MVGSLSLTHLYTLGHSSERLREIQLRTQMENLKAQRQKSMERNRMIRRQMHEFEVNLSAVSAKTHRLRTLKVTFLHFYCRGLLEEWNGQTWNKGYIASLQLAIGVSRHMPHLCGIVLCCIDNIGTFNKHVSLLIYLKSISFRTIYH